MAETKTYELLEAAHKNETALFKRLWREVSDDNMEEIIRIFAEMNTIRSGAIPGTATEKVNELIYIAQNVKVIDVAMSDLVYVT